MADNKGHTSEQATILKSAENWIDWERDLKALAISNEIWTLIGPNSQQPLKFPEEPDFTQEPRGDSSRSTRSTPTPLVTDPAVIQARLAIYNRKIKMYDKQQETIKKVYANMDRDPSIQEEVNRIKKITSDAKGKAPQTPTQ